jgi:hypothetical protein
VRRRETLTKKCLDKFLSRKYNCYIYGMEQAAILKKDLRSKVSGVVVPKDTVVIYSSSMRAVKINVKSNTSDLWIGVRERDIKIIGWKTIK